MTASPAIPAIFRLLSHPVRMRLLLLIAEQPQTVTALQAATSLPQTTISHHLAIMRRAGIARTERRGQREIVYSAGDGDDPSSTSADHIGYRRMVFQFEGCRMTLELDGVAAV